MRFIVAAMTIAAVPASFIAADYPRELVLQHVPTLVGIAILMAVDRRWTMSPMSFYACVVFLWLHIIGARWIYSFVPYDAWFESLTGRTLSSLFGWQRNHYDRWVHFMSGVLGVLPMMEYLRRRCRIENTDAAFLAVAGILAIGAAYEIAEWQIAMTFSPSMAESYNGQQGDVWDAQKDMASALLGSMASATLLRLKRQP